MNSPNKSIRCTGFILISFAIVFPGCNDESEKANRIEQWIREGDSLDSIRYHHEFVTDSVYAADSAMSAEEEVIYLRMDSLYEAEYR